MSNLQATVDDTSDVEDKLVYRPSAQDVMDVLQLIDIDDFWRRYPLPTLDEAIADLDGTRAAPYEGLYVTGPRMRLY